MSTNRSIIDEDNQKIINQLSKILKLGDQTQKELLKTNEQKQEYLLNTISKLNYSIDKNEKLKLDHKNASNNICNLKINIQNEQDKFKQKLIELKNCIQLLNRPKEFDKDLNLIKQLQYYFLKSITNVMLILKDYQVRPCRNEIKNNELFNIELNKTDDLDNLLNETEKQINDLNNQILSIINKLDNKKNEFKSIIQFNDYKKDESDKLFKSMDLLAFNFDKYNL